ncbi:HAD family hydrolase [Tautonia sociabilis]|uniref:HAD family phosphatase n=1 Tax=Tautonia sociabilis TaxID=2080755 RepID=A0A432MM81_9BACT|nr:HAD family phosphatase [Tautonia sociabilis]RUL88390.1 HAD family phosphatase [Tautonia sociabilis]
MPHPALVFDFGNVVAFFDYARACEAIGRPRGLDGSSLLETARRAGLAEPLLAFESGRMGSEQFCRAASRLLGVDLPVDEFAAAWADIFWPNESIVPLIRALADNGHRLILGSNTNPLHSNHFRRQFAETLALFDHLVLSFEVGHVKPAPEFFLACAEAAGAPPADCVFIDDLPENVEGARQAGLIGVHYVDTPTLAADLRALGIPVPSSPR